MDELLAKLSRLHDEKRAHELELKKLEVALK
jgi:hypothetical protein